MGVMKSRCSLKFPKLTYLFILGCIFVDVSSTYPRFYTRHRYTSLFRKSLGNLLERGRNPEENRGVHGVHLIDGDILVHVETRSGSPPNNHEGLSFSQSYAPTLSRKKSTIKNRNWVWTKRVVPFVISNAYDGDLEMKNEIMKAMQEFHSQTCIRFKPRDNEVDYVNILPLNGCFSSVGRQGGMQNLSLSNACRTKGTILHELMHSLGFWHEQSRWDRDEYVRIDLDNVLSMHRMNFAKYSITKQSTLGAPYDYGSILHYKANAFAINPTMPTIIPLGNDPVAATEMGQRERLSPIDIFKVNMLYNCNVTRCNDPGLPENGFREGASFAVGATMTYSCRRGFTLIGSNQRYCMDNGEWTSSQPLCVAGKINYCNFEESLCGWTQDDTDDRDWTRQHAGTPSDQTGPNDDHTLRTTEGHYMFLEASQPTQSGDKARLISPVIHRFAKVLCLKFYYSMHGQGMGTLRVIQRESGQPDYPLFTTSGNKGERWLEGNVLIKPLRPFQIIFEATSGTSYLSDIAIDDIILADRNALSQNDLRIPEQSIRNGSKVLFNCTFEADLCGFKTVTQLKFTLNKGPTKSALTGPSCDHTTCRDKIGVDGDIFKNDEISKPDSRYLYFETSSPRTPGENARILSPEMNGAGIKCTTFYYSMYGSTMGSLHVYLTETHSTNLLWSKSGDQGAGWHKGQVEFQPSGRFSISYEAVRGLSYRSDIGIDDLSVTDGPCFDLAANDPLYSDTSAIGRLKCNFETGTCGWSDSSDSPIQWIRNHGPTDTPLTGPIGDHTPGLNGDGMYIYVDASNRDQGQTARLVSQLLPVDGDGYCLSFWYHMVGQHIGSLRILKAPETGSNGVVWERSGQQIPEGFNQTMSYNSTELQHLWLEGRTYVNSDVPFRIYIEGVVAEGYRGDIAMDDIMLQESNSAHCITL